jgi:hypothetical protein
MKPTASAEAVRVDPPPVMAGSRDRSVTRQQVDRAVTQLRERRHLPAAEQMQAVLRALDLVVVPDPEIPAPREAAEGIRAADARPATGEVPRQA